MAQLVKAPQRFTHPEWTYSNNIKYRSAEIERMAAERLAAESGRLIEETARRTIKTKEDVDKKFDQRLDDIKYWRSELDKKLDDLKNETNKAEEYMKRIEQAIEAVDEPLHIAQHCLINREGRVAIDLVHEDVQKELMKEVEVHHGVQALLQKTLEQAKEQIRLNRKAVYRLEQDIKDKETAKNLDSYCENLKNKTENLNLVDGVANIDINSCDPDQWQSFSNENILNSDRQLQNSLNFRSIVDGVLQQVANDQQAQKETTDLAFKVRIAETKDAKGKLEEHLARVLKEISNMEDNIQNLEVAIQDKEIPLKLTETRLQVRSERPNIEKCNDPTQYKSSSNSAIPSVDRITIRLVEEDLQIKTDIQSLQRRLADSRAALKALVRRQLDLEEDIQVKANTLFIDEVKCMGMRESISLKSF